MPPKKLPQKHRPDQTKSVVLPTNQSDLSIHPTYSKLRLSYSVICRERYKQCREKYDQQFLYEIQKQEAMQNNAYDAMRFHRHFAITTLWPPLHTRKEIDSVINTMYVLDNKQERRLSELLTIPQV